MGREGIRSGASLSRRQGRALTATRVTSDQPEFFEVFPGIHPSGQVTRLGHRRPCLREPPEMTRAARSSAVKLSISW